MAKFKKIESAGDPPAYVHKTQADVDREHQESREKAFMEAWDRDHPAAPIGELLDEITEDGGEE